MADLLIRNVPERTVAALKERANRNSRSVQAEALAIIEAGARYSGDDLVEQIKRLRNDARLRFDVNAALEALRADRSR